VDKSIPNNAVRPGTFDPRQGVGQIVRRYSIASLWLIDRSGLSKGIVGS